MPKPDLAKKKEADNKSLPQLLELDIESKEEAVGLIETLDRLQRQVGKAPDEKKGKEGSGLLAQIAEVKAKLSTIKLLEGLDGLRHNNLVFTDCAVPGRKSVDVQTLRVELAQEGVVIPKELWEMCIERATKEGEGYYRRMLIDLDKTRGDCE